MEPTDELPPAEALGTVDAPGPQDGGLGAPDATPLEIKSAEALESADTPEEGVPYAAFCRPLFDKVIVQMDAPKTREGHLHIPDAHQELPYAATVLAVGEGRLMEGGLAPMYVRPTDRVLFGKYAGIDIPEEYGKRLKVLSQDEILWVFPRPHPATTGDAWPTPRATAGGAADVGEVPLDRAAAPAEDAKG